MTKALPTQDARCLPEGLGGVPRCRADMAPPLFVPLPPPRLTVAERRREAGHYCTWLKPDVAYDVAFRSGGLQLFASGSAGGVSLLTRVPIRLVAVRTGVVEVGGRLD